MNVYLVYPTDPNFLDKDENGYTYYDHYSGYVCVADNPEEAKRMRPESTTAPGDAGEDISDADQGWLDHSWPCKPEDLTAVLIATGADGPARVVMASYHAG